jgi:hypothetical protein
MACSSPTASLGQSPVTLLHPRHRADCCPKPQTAVDRPFVPRPDSPCRHPPSTTPRPHDQGRQPRGRPGRPVKALVAVRAQAPLPPPHHRLPRLLCLHGRWVRSVADKLAPLCPRPQGRETGHRVFTPSHVRFPGTRHTILIQHTTTQHYDRSGSTQAGLVGWRWAADDDAHSPLSMPEARKPNPPSAGRKYATTADRTTMTPSTDSSSVYMYCTSEYSTLNTQPTVTARNRNT